MVFEGQNSFISYYISTISTRRQDQLQLNKEQALRPDLHSLWWSLW